MKIKILSRCEQEFTRDRQDDIMKVHRDPDPILHPFERAREYVRALNATKLDKVFAKPFIGALEGHMDGVFSMATNKKSLVSFVSGACDGEIKVWDITSKKNLWSAVAHDGFVRGLVCDNSGRNFYSCGDDKAIKAWRFFPEHSDLLEDDNGNDSIILAGKREKTVEPRKVYASNFPILGISHHFTEDSFAICGDSLDVYDSNRTQPVHSFSWGADTISSCSFNPAEVDLIASTGNDRSISLYDIRQNLPVRKVVLNMNSNCISWNPQEPFRFVVGNEDHNCYTFDIRHFEKPIVLHRQHVGAVLSVSFSPTGKEFVTGSYDKSVRIFEAENSMSREVYTTKRMQRIFCVNFTQDARFVLSGSDDTNVRIWKSKANEKLGSTNDRQQRSMNYNEKLVNRYKHAKEIKKIANHKHLPKNTYKMVKRKREMITAEERRENNRIEHSGGKLQKLPDKMKLVVKEIE